MGNFSGKVFRVPAENNRKHWVFSAEYPYHEGNYAIVNVLRGARVQEAHAACRRPLNAHRPRLRRCASAETGGSLGDIRA